MDILEEVQDLLSVDEAFIQSELEKEKKMQLDINEAKQNIDKEVPMQETLRNIETEPGSPISENYNNTK